MFIPLHRVNKIKYYKMLQYTGELKQKFTENTSSKHVT